MQGCSEGIREARKPARCWLRYHLSRWEFAREGQQRSRKQGSGEYERDSEMPEREQREQGGSEDRRTEEAGVAHYPNTWGGGQGPPRRVTCLSCC